ncbi:hypothetical protein B8V81_4778 [Paenibacillus pasadenensis]|uniref:Uncharacterized protein n=1 Tax=Paenibacillus pasadenensis TaxID=217090 RepID=A0A2N5N7L7_9BACL|nr:hypothetical protein B8V81_4778 [Paenibacillus pasadenensis]
MRTISELSLVRRAGQAAGCHAPQGVVHLRTHRSIHPRAPGASSLPHAAPIRKKENDPTWP